MRVGMILLGLVLLPLIAYAVQEGVLAGRILPGVWVEDVYVGGKTVEEAVTLLRDRVDRRFRVPVAVRVLAQEGMQEWRVTARSLGLAPDPLAAAREAYAVGRTGTFRERLRTRWQLWHKPVVIRVPIRRRSAQLKTFLDQVAKTVYRPPVDARFVVEKGEVRILPSRDGLALDVEAAGQRLVHAALEGRREVVLPVRKVEPRLSTREAEAMGIREVVAEFSTPLAPNPDRTHNIALAARLLRGRVLRTGEVFSFNAVVGPRTRARGFRPAPVILNDEFVPGDGGGVCQVSSTLFNAALLAGLTVLRRTNHSVPVDYLPIGRDAMVVYGAVDLVLRNDGPPLLLWAEVQDGRLRIQFYGRKHPNRQIEILVTDVVRINPPMGQVVRVDPELPEGAWKILPPRPGFRATTWRIVREGGRVVRREVVARSFYRPLPAVVKIGGRVAALLPRSP